MHGLGNDFVVFDARDTAHRPDVAKARAIADRHFGVGCDTVVGDPPRRRRGRCRYPVLQCRWLRSRKSCFNATRCVARLLMDERGLARVKLSTKGGMLICSDAGKGIGDGGYGRRRGWSGSKCRWPAGRHA